jgi:hypothetical protein
MIRKGTVVITSVAVLAAGCGGASSSTPESAVGGGGDDDVTVSFSEQNDSGLSGTATLTAEGDKTSVVIDLQNRKRTGASVPQPAHIHKGSCENLDPAPAYGLTDLRDGKSTTTVDAKLADLRAGQFAINVHKSAEEIDDYVSCGSFGEGNEASNPGYSESDY